MTFSDYDKIDLLENTIRSGCQPDCPNLIYDYFEIGFKHHRGGNQLKSKTHERAFNTLLETICDPLISRHWRQTCLDNIYIPLLRFQREANSEKQKKKVAQMYRELRALSNYFLQ